jgi:uncharacterized membrane protein YccC
LFSASVRPCVGNNGWHQQAPLGVERASPFDVRDVRAMPTKIVFFPGRSLLPVWLVRMLRPAPISADWTRICAAAVGIGAPQLVGLLLGRLDEAVLASVGALCVSFSDLTTSYRYRLRRVAFTAVLGACGFAVGAAAVSPWWAACTVIAVSVISVLCSRMSDVWAAAGAQMLTFCIVATGRAAGAPLGEQILWFVSGELLLIAMVAVTWPFRRTAPARVAVARVFEATLRLFDAVGSDATTTARQDLTKALNTAHDILISGASVARSRVHDRLYVVLSNATGVVEASVALAHAGNRPPRRVLDALGDIARCARAGELAPEYPLPEPGADSPTVEALDHALADLVVQWRRAKLADPQVRREQRGSRPDLWSRTVAAGRFGREAALRMALCLAVAEGVGLALGFDQPYWIALTVALVLKPHSGSVFARIVLRAIGTVLGVLIAASLLAFVPTGWWLLPFSVALAALLPEALSRHYGLFSMVVTAMVLVQMNQSELFADQLPQARLVDSLIGCAIVLVVGYLWWPQERGPALPLRLADAVGTVSEYVASSLAGLPQGRSALRRRTYRELSDLRAALQQQLLEPGATRRTAEQWWPTITVLERIVDAATERAVLIERGAHEYRLQHTQRVVSSMRTVARQLRTSCDEAEIGPRRRLEEVYAEVVASDQCAPSESTWRS